MFATDKPIIQPVGKWSKHFTASPTSVAAVDEDLLVVGTLTGSLETLSMASGATAVVYRHKLESQIVGILLQRPGKSGDGDQPGRSRLIVHFRASAVVIFEVEDFAKLAALKPVKSIPTEHYGFCQVIYDPVGEKLIVPNKIEGSDSALSIHYANGSEKILTLGRDFLLSSFARHSQIILDAATTTEWFKGIIQGLKPLSADKVLIAFEDATFVVVDLASKAVSGIFKPPAQYCQLIDFDVIDGQQSMRVAVTVASRIFEMQLTDGSFELTKRVKKTGYCGVNCSRLAFTPTGENLICAFSNGKIEIYTVPSYDVVSMILAHHSSLLFMSAIDSSAEKTLLFTGDDRDQLCVTQVEVT